MTHPTDTLLTVNDLAEILGLTARAIYNRRHRGDALPPVTPVGRSLRWERGVVENWLREQREGATNQDDQ